MFTAQRQAPWLHTHPSIISHHPVPESCVSVLHSYMKFSQCTMLRHAPVLCPCCPFFLEYSCSFICWVNPACPSRSHLGITLHQASSTLQPPCSSSLSPADDQSPYSCTHFFTQQAFIGLYSLPGAMLDGRD